MASLLFQLDIMSLVILYGNEEWSATQAMS